MAKHRWPTRPIQEGLVFRYGGRANGTGGIFVRWYLDRLEPIK
uniref:Uncharacterized protein n=1 Tax=Mycobacterium phage BabyBack TaxID=3158877 RepID=A0AAU8GRI1_9CAUD